MTEKKNGKKLWIGLAALVILVTALAVIYGIFRAKPTAGSKEISIEVVNSQQSSTVYDLQTDAEYLRQAIEEAEGLTFEGDESEFGLMIHTINGETADFNNGGAYWSFYVNDEYCNYGVESQPVNDGDKFRIEYTTGN